MKPSVKRSLKRSIKRSIIAVMSDPHANYLYGLMRTGIVLDPRDEQEDAWLVESTPTQRMLWDWQVADYEAIVALAAGDRMGFLLAGDVGHGTFLPDNTRVSTRLSDEYAIAVDFLLPWAQLPNMAWMRFVHGSGVHSMKRGSAELLVAQELRDRTGKDIRAWYHLDLRVDGLMLDVAHKGPPTGSRVWLEGNEVRYYTRSLMLKFLVDGERPPDAVLRGHYHDRILELVHIHTRKETYRTWGVICPANALFIDDYTKSATKSKEFMTAGMLAIEVIDGRIVDIHDFSHVADIRRHEVIDRGDA
jgi:hypothetical protein